MLIIAELIPIMKIAISNIAWMPSEDEEMYRMMRDLDIQGLEISPFRIWKHSNQNSQNDLLRFVRKIEQKNIRIIAMQALLYNQPHLKIFGSREVRFQTLEYLKRCILMGAQLGVKPLVLGAPKNRVIGKMDRNKAIEIALDFFCKLGDFAHRNGVFICIEPSPKEYGTDFICNTKEGIHFIKQLNNPGIKLHMDLGAMTMNEERYEQAIEAGLKLAVHFHISEPHLQLISSRSKTDHKRIFKVLHNLEYDKWVSIEMRAISKLTNVASVRNALKFVKEIYDS